MKELKIKKGTIKLIGLIILSIFLLLILFWLGYSFFSMKSEKPLFDTPINMKEKDFAQKVVFEQPIKEGKYLKYPFNIIPLEVTENKDSYTIKAVDYNYLSKYEDIEDAQFEFDLIKSGGNFDFTQLGWDQPLKITVIFRIEKDFKYFFEYSSCTVNKWYSDLLGKQNVYTLGQCFLNREIVKWEIEIIEEVIQEEIETHLILERLNSIKKYL